MPIQPNVTVIDPKRAQSLDLDRLMSELPEGYKLQIFRKEPIWADGNCETTDIDPNEPISMEAIRQRWGGRKLVVKILNPDGTYLKSSTLSFPDPPKQDGVELVLSPQGTPIRKDKLEEQTRQVEQHTERGHGQGGEALTMIQHLLTLQSNQNAAMQKLLQDRVNHLEKLLETRSGHSEGGGQGGGLFDGVRDTVKAIKEVEALRAAMIINNPNAAPAIAADGFGQWQPAIEKLIDFALDMQRAKLETKSAAQQVPALPRPEKTRLLPVEELISQVQTRLQGVDPDTKRQIIAQVIGEDIEDYDDDDDDDDENDDSNDNDAAADRSCAASGEGVKLDLLSEKDRAVLGQNGGESPKTS